MRVSDHGKSFFLIRVIHSHLSDEKNYLVRRLFVVMARFRNRLVSARALGQTMLSRKKCVCSAISWLFLQKFVNWNKLRILWKDNPESKIVVL